MRYVAPVVLGMEPRKYSNCSHKYDRKKTFKVRKCPTCGRAWDLFNGTLTHLTDFPKYGLKIEVCPRCKAQA